MSNTIAGAVAFILGGVAGALALFVSQMPVAEKAAAPPERPVWTEVNWPFPMDPWGRGKAFRCSKANCGTEVKLYLRAKIGFCNCATGVADDEELERLSDFHFAGKQLSAIGDGRAIAVAWMKGRSRAYAVAGADAPGRSALSVAFNDRCDAIVATAVLGHDRPGTIEPSVLAFLNGSTVLRWAEITIGL